MTRTVAGVVPALMAGVEAACQVHSAAVIPHAWYDHARNSCLWIQSMPCVRLLLCIQVYLCDDRLCYQQPDEAGHNSHDVFSSLTSSPKAKATAAATAAAVAASREGSPDLPLVGYYGLVGSTAVSLAALAAGEVRYIALDRVPVRPLPHRQHELDPLERSHPDAGITLVDDR